MAGRGFSPDLFDNDDLPALQMNERVVWISDNGPEYGNIRWLGKLPDLGKEWMAGVEFDNPVGSGTGLYKDRQLFKTQMNHASLVPIIGLLRASDFDEPPPSSPPPPPPKPPVRDSSVNLMDIYESEFKNSQRARSLFQRTANNSSITSLSDPMRRDQMVHQIVANYNKPNTERVVNIPIRIEPREQPSLTTSNTPAPRKSHNISSKPVPSKYSSRNEDSSYHLANNSSTENLVDALKRSRIHDVELARDFCAPTLVVGAEEKNPSLALANNLGKSKGIQGHNNSCYLDATLFSMFSSTTQFDSLLHRPPNRNDIPEYKEIQRILRDDIVRPLRTEHFVSADRVMKFRTILERASTVAGLTDEEKDPEEFLSLLLGKILKADPYLKLSSGLESFFYQLIADKDESVVLPSVQDLFEQSIMSSPVRLREIPPCLLLQMPRFGRQYKMYPRIKPSLRLDITDVLESVPRSCGHRSKDCDNLARYECKDCFSERSGQANVSLASLTYCGICFQHKHFGKSHSTGIESHNNTKTVLDKIPLEAISRYSNKLSNAKDKEIPRVCMDLVAVLCIETSHYVSFVKCGAELDSPWCFFDSMADRRGEQDGYNIPEVLMFDEFSFWTSDKGVSYLLNHKDDKLLPEMARRLICDSYFCFYQYPGLSTYR